MKKCGYNPKNKKIILLFYSILLPCALLAQEMIVFVAERDTVASDWAGNESIIHAGSYITSDAAILVSPLSAASNEAHLVIYFAPPNDQYATFAKHFRPLNTEGVFGERIFINYPMDRRDPNFINTWGDFPATISDAMWVPLYYAYILQGKNRNMLIDIHPRLELSDDGGNPWYINSVVNLLHGRAMFYNSVISLGFGTYLAVRNIQKTDFGYRVDCVLSIHSSRTRWGTFPALAGGAFWEAYNPGDPLTLLLFLDGDYLDIYTYGTGIHVGTFIRVGREFQIQYQSLIRTNTADLTNVQWPQRADGSRNFTRPFVASFYEETAEELSVAPAQDNAIETAAIVPQADKNVTAENGGGMPELSVVVWLAVAGGTAIVGGAAFAVRRKRG